MQPGTRVRIKVCTWVFPSGNTGIVHTENLTEGLISICCDSDEKLIYDFLPEQLEIIDDKG